MNEMELLSTDDAEVPFVITFEAQLQLPPKIIKNVFF
jgi:hypothetical protein